MKYKLLTIIPCILGLGFLTNAEEATSKSGERMNEFYTRFPKSDVDKDGVLTLDEMYNYLDKKIKDGSTSEMKGKFVSGFYLKEILEKSPGADLNQDGILTKVELLEFLKKQKAIAAEKTTVVKT